MLIGRLGDGIVIRFSSIELLINDLVADWIDISNGEIVALVNCLRFNMVEIICR